MPTMTISELANLLAPGDLPERADDARPDFRRLDFAQLLAQGLKDGDIDERKDDFARRISEAPGESPPSRAALREDLYRAKEIAYGFGTTAPPEVADALGWGSLAHQQAQLNAQERRRIAANSVDPRDLPWQDPQWYRDIAKRYRIDIDIPDAPNIRLARPEEKSEGLRSGVTPMAWAFGGTAQNPGGPHIRVDYDQVSNLTREELEDTLAHEMVHTILPQGVSHGPAFAQYADARNISLRGYRPIKEITDLPNVVPEHKAGGGRVRVAGTRATPLLQDSNNPVTWQDVRYSLLAEPGDRQLRSAYDRRSHLTSTGTAYLVPGSAVERAWPEFDGRPQMWEIGTVRPNGEVEWDCLTYTEPSDDARADYALRGYCPPELRADEYQPTEEERRRLQEAAVVLRSAADTGETATYYRGKWIREKADAAILDSTLTAAERGDLLRWLSRQDMVDLEAAAQKGGAALGKYTRRYNAERTRLIRDRDPSQIADLQERRERRLAAPLRPALQESGQRYPYSVIAVSGPDTDDQGRAVLTTTPVVTETATTPRPPDPVDAADAPIPYKSLATPDTPQGALFMGAPKGDPAMPHPAATAGVVTVDLDELYTRPDFQARDSAGDSQTDESSVENIVENYDPAKFDPIVVAVRPEGGYFIIGGHHRTEAKRRLGHGEIEARVVEGDVRNPEDLQRLQRLARSTNVAVAGQSPRELLRTVRPLINERESDRENVAKIANEVRALGPTDRERRRQAQVFYNLASLPDEMVERAEDEAALPVLASIGEAKRKYGLSDVTVEALARRYAFPRDYTDEEIRDNPALATQQFAYPRAQDLQRRFRQAAARQEEAAAQGNIGAFSAEGFGVDPFLEADKLIIKEAKQDTAEMKKLRAQLEACRALSSQHPGTVDLEKLERLTQEQIAGVQTTATGLDALAPTAARAIIAWQEGRGPKPPYGDAILRQFAPEMYDGKSQTAPETPSLLGPQSDSPSEPTGGDMPFRLMTPEDVERAPEPQDQQAGDDDEETPFVQSGPDLFGMVHGDDQAERAADPPPDDYTVPTVGDETPAPLVQTDVDGDGDVDRVAIDSDGDGKVDTVEWTANAPEDDARPLGPAETALRAEVAELQEQYPDTWRPTYQGLQPMHQVHDLERVHLMMETLRDGGQLPPIVADGDQALTGVHRMATGQIVQDRNLPYNVDVVQLQTLPEHLQEQIREMREDSDYEGIDELMEREWDQQQAQAQPTQPAAPEPPAEPAQLGLFGSETPSEAQPEAMGAPEALPPLSPELEANLATPGVCEDPEGTKRALADVQQRIDAYTDRVGIEDLPLNTARVQLTVAGDIVPVQGQPRAFRQETDTGAAPPAFGDGGEVMALRPVRPPRPQRERSTGDYTTPEWDAMPMARKRLVVQQLNTMLARRDALQTELDYCYPTGGSSGDSAWQSGAEQAAAQSVPAPTERLQIAHMQVEARPKNGGPIERVNIAAAQSDRGPVAIAVEPVGRPGALYDAATEAVTDFSASRKEPIRDQDSMGGSGERPKTPTIVKPKKQRATGRGRHSSIWQALR